MKKMVPGFALALAALALMIPPALAAGSPPPAALALSSADQAFIASLAVPAPASAVERPIEKSATLCSATVDCGGGISLSCTSTTSSASCSSVDRDCLDGKRGSVTCDGVKTKCPVCFVDCEPAYEDCLGTCGQCGIGTFQCTPYVCNCKACT